MMGRGSSNSPALEEFLLSLYEDASEDEIRALSKSMGIDHDKLLEIGEQTARKAMREATLSRGTAFQERTKELVLQIREAIACLSPAEQLTKMREILQGEGTTPALELCRHLEDIEPEQIDDVLEDAMLLSTLHTQSDKENDGE